MLFLLLCTLILKKINSKGLSLNCLFYHICLNIVTIYKKYVAICQIICIPIFHYKKVFLFLKKEL